MNSGTSGIDVSEPTVRLYTHAASIGFGVDCSDDGVGRNVHQPKFVRTVFRDLFQLLDGVFAACDCAFPDQRAVRQHFKSIVDAIHLPSMTRERRVLTPVNRRHAVYQTGKSINPLDFWRSHESRVSNRDNPVKNTRLAPLGHQVNT